MAGGKGSTPTSPAASAAQKAVSVAEVRRWRAAAARARSSVRYSRRFRPPRLADLKDFGRKADHRPHGIFHAGRRDCRHKAHSPAGTGRGRASPPETCRRNCTGKPASAAIARGRARNARSACGCAATSRSSAEMKWLIARTGAKAAIRARARRQFGAGQAEPVHAGVDMDRRRMGRAVGAAEFGPFGDFRQRAEHRDQAARRQNCRRSRAAGR